MCENGSIWRIFNLEIQNVSLSLRKHPFLLALRRWGHRAKRPQRRRARRNGCFRRLRLTFCISRLKIRRKRYKWKERVQKNAQFSFCGQTRTFHYEIVFRGTVLLSAGFDFKFAFGIEKLPGLSRNRPCWKAVL